jgi:hypothetical protein
MTRIFRGIEGMGGRSEEDFKGLRAPEGKTQVIPIGWGGALRVDAGLLFLRFPAFPFIIL